MKKFILNYWVYIIPTTAFLGTYFFVFMMIVTCINFFGIVKLLLFVTSFVSLFYYQLAKKFNWFHFQYINLLIYAYIVPMTAVVVLGVNYFTTKIVYTEKFDLTEYKIVKIDYLYINGELMLIDNGNKRPNNVCEKLFQPSIYVDAYGKKYIETKIGKGLFGYYVLKAQKTY